jgi:hypothetical protein
MLVCYSFCCFVIVQEVVRRFVLNYSSAWAEETARYAFIYLGWLGAAYAVRERAHIRFDILFGAIPKRLHGWLYLFGELMTLVFAFALYYSMHDPAAARVRRDDAGAPHQQGLVRGGGAARLRAGGRAHLQAMRATSPTCAPAARRTPARRCSTNDAPPMTVAQPPRPRALLVVGVPFWVCLGIGTVVMLATTGVLPLTLVGEALFEGIDSFALIAIRCSS